MSAHGEGQVGGRQRLENSQTLAEILHTATRFEESARNFYRDLAPRVSKRIRWLVDELAAEEQQHYELFSTLMQRDDIHEQIRERIATPASDHRFSDHIHLPDLGDNPDDQAVLQYAMGREHAAMEQYRELAVNTAQGPIHDLFIYLADEETQHKTELEKLYYELVHSGGV